MNVRDLAWVIKYPKVMPRYSLGREASTNYWRFINDEDDRLENQISSSDPQISDRKFLILKKADHEP